MTESQPGVGWAQHREGEWESGKLHGLEAAGSSKRLKGTWREKTRSLKAIYEELQPRVDACWKQSVGVQVCQALGDQLHKAMKDAPVEDLRLSVAGEKHRILTRALAMHEVLRVQDPTLGALQVRVEPSPSSGQLPSNSMQPKGSRCPVTPVAHGSQGGSSSGSRVVMMQRSSNEADPDASPDQCVLAVCMLMAALYEQTPWGEGSDLRRRVFHDFTYLKRHFRQDELQMMYGRTGSTQELFGAIKALDRSKGLQNLVGLVFEDWKVNQRVESVILCDKLEVEVLTLTSDGPIGKFKCTLRTLMTLGLLHQRLLSELYAGIFDGRTPPSKQYDGMSSEDPLDFIDFVEAMGRNIPHKHVESSDLYYAWMYAPEVHAAPEVWEQAFGPGANKLPTLFDGVTTPDEAVVIMNKDGDYALDIHTAAKHDFLEEGSAQAAVGFPWADDLIGAYLRKLKQELADRQQQQQQQLGRSSSSTGSVGGGATAQGSPPVAGGVQQAGIKQESSCGAALKPVMQDQGVPAQLSPPSQPHQPVTGPGPGPGPAGEVQQQQQQQQASQQQLLQQQQLQHQSGPQLQHQQQLGGRRRRLRNLEMSSRQAWCMRARAGTQWAPRDQRRSGSGGGGFSGPGMARMGKKPVIAHHKQPGSPRSPKQPYQQQSSQRQTPQQVAGEKLVEGGEKPEVARIPDADETGQLALPLGIFMVGLIVSGAFTNTQVHVEDLLLMSININMFGAPKVWWWIPQESVQAFKEAAELMTEGGRGELYTKSISPFLTDREHPGHPEQVLPLERLKELGAKRTIQLPGMGIWTMPGYAFHFTVSMGMNVAESCNMFLELMGWNFDKLWMARPLEQYPEPEDDMSRYMRETGLLRRLGVADRLPRSAAEVHKELGKQIRPGIVKTGEGQHLHRQVYSELVKYCTVSEPSSASDVTGAVIGDATSQPKQPVPIIGRKRRGPTVRTYLVSASSQQLPAIPPVVNASPPPVSSGSSEGEADDSGTQQVVLPPDIIKELAQFAAVLPSVTSAAPLPSVTTAAPGGLQPITPAGLQPMDVSPAGAVLL